MGARLSAARSSEDAGSMEGGLAPEPASGRDPAEETPESLPDDPLASWPYEGSGEPPAFDGRAMGLGGDSSYGRAVGQDDEPAGGRASGLGACLADRPVPEGAHDASAFAAGSAATVGDARAASDRQPLGASSDAHARAQALRAQAVSARSARDELEVGQARLSGAPREGRALALLCAVVLVFALVIVSVLLGDALGLR